ncbi:MAG: hydroxymethylbilane synthase [bacterium]
METKFKIGTRTSPLALAQVREIKQALFKRYPEISFEVHGFDTYGDKDKKTPISEIEGTDFFTREIDSALINHDIDLAIHSAKDLADHISEELVVAAITDSIDPYDVLVSRDNIDIDHLPYGARVGTSSNRRKKQIAAYRKDLVIINIRGNIEERLQFLEENVSNSKSVDALVLAAAGLVRLGLEHCITQRLPFDIVKPHHLQGCLTVVVRKKDKELIKMLSVLGLDRENERREVYEN